MVDPKKKGKYIGMVGALLVHVAFILLLILVGFVLPEQQDEDGMPVMLVFMFIAPYTSNLISRPVG